MSRNPILFQLLERLEQCKQISKADRLRLREQIKARDTLLIELLLQPDLKTIQTSLRRHISTEKLSRETTRVRECMEARARERDSRRKRFSKDKSRQQLVGQQIYNYKCNNSQHKTQQDWAKSRQETINKVQELEQLPEEPFEIFEGKIPEQLVKFFFIGQTQIGRQTFVFRLEEHARMMGVAFSFPVLNTYFDVLFERGPSASIKEGVLDIGTLGEILDQYGLPSSDQLRSLFKTIDKEHRGYVTKYSVDSQEWQRLFLRANPQQKPTISYWDIFACRNSPEFVGFHEWLKLQP